MHWWGILLIVLSAGFLFMTVVVILLASLVLGISDSMGQAFGYSTRRRRFRR